MPKGMKTCKVCGKKYEYCRNLVPSNVTFRWQDVACCPEHGEEYLRQVMEARGLAKKTEPAPEAAPVKEATPKKRAGKKKIEAEETQAVDKEMA